MQTITRKNQSDVVFLFELSPLIGVCYENILENYLKPLLTYFYGLSINDDIGIIKDLNGTVFCAIGYKNLDCTPLNLCDVIQPTSHVKLFYEKLENIFEFSFGLNDDKSHLAEGLAVALDTFEELDKRRNKACQTRHIILIACQNAYEDIPVFESKSYKGLLFEEILQNLQKQQINLSIISPKYSPDLIKLYEKVNRSSGEFKLERVNNMNYFILWHKSIHLESYEQQQHQQQLQAPVQQLSQNINLNPLSNKAEHEYSQPHSIKMEINESIGTPLSNQNYQQLNQQQTNNIINQNPNSNSNMMNQTQFQPQQQQQPMQIPQQQQINYHQNSPMQPSNIHQPIANQNEIYNQQQQIQQQKQLQHQQQIQHQMNPQQAQQQVHPSQQTQPQMNMNQQNQVLLQQQQQRIGINQVNPNQQQIQIGQNQPQNAAQIQQQQILRQGQTPQQIQTQPSPQQPILPSQTPPISTVPINQQQQQQQIIMQNYNNQIGMSPSSAGANANNQAVIGNKQPIFNAPGQQQQMQQTSQASYVNNYVQPQAQIKIWVGQIEWQEKDRNNPNNPNKMTHSVKASMLCSNVHDPATNQYQPDVPITIAQSWPQKINIQLLSKQILDILSQHCPPPAKTLVLSTEENNQDLKTALSIGGGLIHFPNNANLEIKLLLVINQGNDVVCKVPSDQNKFLNALKQIIQRQKQQQLQQQQPHIQQQQQPILQQQQQQIQHIQQIQPQQQQRTIMNNPNLMQQQIQGNPVLMQNTVQQQTNQVMMNPNQSNEPAKDLRNLLNGPNQSSVIGISSQQQKMPMQQQANPNWINASQVQQQQLQQQQTHIQQQTNQIYITNTSSNIVQQQQQQQKPNQNFQFYDNYNN